MKTKRLQMIYHLITLWNVPCLERITILSEERPEFLLLIFMKSVPWLERIATSTIKHLSFFCKYIFMESALFRKDYDII